MPTLPDEIEAELTAFTSLSDDVLWLLARSTLPETEQERLAELNYQAKQRDLTEAEETERDRLLDSYNRVMVRRAEAALLLKARGYDLANTNVLQ